MGRRHGPHELGGNSIHPMVAVSEEAVHVIWCDDRDGNNEIYYKNRNR
ncbi:MAG TPA: hypothetical protein HPP77_01305 [Candidatus Hydrogenedentes bacterium]|nr:hypothetical protein [Candidatus Hydrogenedentota bacterium]HIJ73196.1 hypothetical protein [Candidatus Hydrogenedentota bacterium]